MIKIGPFKNILPKLLSKESIASSVKRLRKKVDDRWVNFFESNLFEFLPLLLLFCVKFIFFLANLFPILPFLFPVCGFILSFVFIRKKLNVFKMFHFYFGAIDSLLETMMFAWVHLKVRFLALFICYRQMPWYMQTKINNIKMGNSYYYMEIVYVLKIIKISKIY